VPSPKARPSPPRPSRRPVRGPSARGQGSHGRSPPLPRRARPGLHRAPRPYKGGPVSPARPCPAPASPRRRRCRALKLSYRPSRQARRRPRFPGRCRLRPPSVSISLSSPHPALSISRSTLDPSSPEHRRRRPPGPPPPPCLLLTALSKGRRRCAALHLGPSRKL
jgi:hypothetical protein